MDIGQPTDAEVNINQDRFEKLSNNYCELFTEVFAEQGLDYKKFEESVYNIVAKMTPNKNTAILDIGTGDGATIAPFVKAGYENLTGIDLNPEMLEAAKEKFGAKANWIQMDATNMSAFKKEQFPIIVTGAAIHNIPKEKRKLFWKELLRLSPEIFVSAEKITDPNPETNKKNYKKEIEAIKKIYGEKHGLKEAEQEWLDHYKYDESEKLEIKEILDNIGADYSVEIAFEMGMYKTIVAKKINK